jgi:hypothetical protein
LVSPSSGSYDRFIVIGDLYMDGLLQFLSGGYAPRVDDYFTSFLSWTGVLSFGSSFNVAGLDLGDGYALVLNWNRNSLDLAVSRSPDAAVPEPATWLGVGSALLIVAVRQLRRRAW